MCAALLMLDIAAAALAPPLHCLISFYCVYGPACIVKGQRQGLPSPACWTLTICPQSCSDN
ncbi:hypothetical protein LZ31DRAFT_551400 [Colletotrichum somersetense]|nr:hypothetical protein LZ31DRAFT_551400 [Colletotrichum somersetense]